MATKTKQPSQSDSTVETTAIVVEPREEKLNPSLVMAKIGLAQYAANASLAFPESISFTGVKVDGNMASVTLTSEIEVSDKDNQWFSLTVGYLTSVKASNLDKSPLEINGQKYKRPSEKLTVIKPLITFSIDRAGKVSNTPPKGDWMQETGLGGSYGNLVFPYLQKLVDKWENPLSLLFLMLFTKATKETDNTELSDDGTATFKPLAYEPLSLVQRLETLTQHHSILQDAKHPSAGNFAVTAKKARMVLDKMDADKKELQTAQNKPAKAAKPKTEKAIKPVTEATDKPVLEVAAIPA